MMLDTGSPMLLGGLAIIVALSGWLAVIDIRDHRLPDRLTQPLTGFVALWVLGLGFVTGDAVRGVQALGWGVAAFVAFLVLSFAGMGGGDVKFAAPLGATLGWFGWSSIYAAIVGMVFSAGFVAIIVLLQGKGKEHRVAFGPYMLIGLLCGIVRGLVG